MKTHYFLLLSVLLFVSSCAVCHQKMYPLANQLRPTLTLLSFSLGIKGTKFIAGMIYHALGNDTFKVDWFCQKLHKIPKSSLG